jgi:hypothetical protein
MRDKAYQLKPLLTDRNALSQCETEIRECQKYIDYFTEELFRLTSKSGHEPSTESVADTRDVKKYSTLGKYHPYYNYIKSSV